MTTVSGFALPSALSTLTPQPRWVVWKLVKKDNGKFTKPPYQGRDPSRFADSTEPETWTDFETCRKLRTEGKVDGIGFALKDSDIGAVDIDDCRNKDTGL